MPNSTDLNSTERFSNRVEDYKKHRPNYPRELIRILTDHGALTENAVVADIGSGTGHLTKILLPHSQTVYGVEPNDEMRLEAEKYFYGLTNHISINGSAELTGLPDQSVDLLTAAQAFHWFDAEKTRREFKRILKPEGYVALIWNVRDTEADDFQRKYEQMLRTHIINYKQTFARTASNEHIHQFFAPNEVKIVQLANEQTFDLQALKGRLMSSSYAPKPPDPVFDILMRELEKLFIKFHRNDRVKFIYKTKIYLSQL